MEIGLISQFLGPDDDPDQPQQINRPISDLKI